MPLLENAKLAAALDRLPILPAHKSEMLKLVAGEPEFRNSSLDFDEEENGVVVRRSGSDARLVIYRCADPAVGWVFFCDTEQYAVCTTKLAQAVAFACARALP